MGLGRNGGIALAVQAVVVAAVVAQVAYTNIDWNAYMEQVAAVAAGERDYSRIRGDTGPLVYPAGHVWLYSLLAPLPLRTVQWLFAALLLGTSAAVLLLAARLEPRGPPLWAALLLVASRRATSVFVLRLFNDGPAALLLYAALVAGASPLATLLLSAACAVKMSALLALPGYGAVLLRRGGWGTALRHAALFLALQAALGLPFLAAAPAAYLGRAFELTRVFEHRWSVNWAFLPPALFVSPGLAAALLAAHAGLLLLLAHRRWGGLEALLWGPRRPPSPAFAVRAPLEALLAGILCARTLHYQVGRDCCCFLPIHVCLSVLGSVPAGPSAAAARRPASCTPSALGRRRARLQPLPAAPLGRPASPGRAHCLLSLCPFRPRH